MKKRKLLIDAGIICILIGIICELFIRNFYILIMIIPLIYLISVRNSIGKNGSVDDIEQLTKLLITKKYRIDEDEIKRIKI